MKTIIKEKNCIFVSDVTKKWNCTPIKYNSILNILKCNTINLSLIMKGYNKQKGYYNAVCVDTSEEYNVFIGKEEQNPAFLLLFTINKKTIQL